MLFHIKNCDNESDARSNSLKRALYKAHELSKNFSLAVNKKEELEYGIIEDVLGRSVINQLMDKNAARAKEHRIKLITESIMPGSIPEGPIVCAYVSVNLLQELISRYRQNDLVYIPWTYQELAIYLDNHRESLEI
jgi:hypothetical protein